MRAGTAECAGTLEAFWLVRVGAGVACPGRQVASREQPATVQRVESTLPSQGESTICYAYLNQRQEPGHQEQNTAKINRVSDSPRSEPEGTMRMFPLV